MFFTTLFANHSFVNKPFSTFLNKSGFFTIFFKVSGFNQEIFEVKVSQIAFVHFRAHQIVFVAILKGFIVCQIFFAFSA
jgi:hypothetical protein